MEKKFAKEENLGIFSGLLKVRGREEESKERETNIGIKLNARLGKKV